MSKVKVRITKTWETDVEAEYGDTDASLMEKAKAKGEPENVSKAILRTPEQEAALVVAREGITKKEALKQVKEAK